MIHHYPLQWPIGWPHFDGIRNYGGFQVTYDQAERELTLELERLKAESAYIATDQALTLNGRPSTRQKPETPGVALYFVRDGKQLCIPCDRFATPSANLRAIGLTLEAVRRLERYGTSQMVEAALSGFAALPATATESSVRSWSEVLQVSPDADQLVVRAAYRNLAAKYHPDNPTTGDPRMFEAIQRAWMEYQG